MFTTVPRDIWERNRVAHDAARRLGERLPSVARVGVSGHGEDPRLVVEYRGAPDEGPRRRLTVTQEEPPSAARVAGTLPETATGSVGRGGEASEHTFDVEFEERRLGFLEPLTIKEDDEFAAQSSDDFDSRYEDIPAGCKIVTERRFQGQTYVKSTSTTPALTEGWPYLGRILTAGHAFTGDGDETGKNAWQADRNSGDRYGSCNQAKWDHVTDTRFDAAVSSVNENGRGVQYKIADDDGGTRNGNIGGIVEWDGLEQGTVDTLSKQGISTGYQGFEDVTRTYPRTSNAYRNIAVSAPTQSGDSGGPLFDTRFDFDGSGMDTTYLIAGSVYNGDSNVALATYIGEVESEFGVIV